MLLVLFKAARLHLRWLAAMTGLQPWLVHTGATRKSHNRPQAHIHPFPIYISCHLKSQDIPVLYCKMVERCNAHLL